MLTYLDHAATTPMRPVSVEAMLPFFSERFANPSGSHRFARLLCRWGLDRGDRGRLTGLRQDHRAGADLGRGTGHLERLLTLGALSFAPSKLLLDTQLLAAMRAIDSNGHGVGP